MERKVIITANTTDEEIYALSEALNYQEHIVNGEGELIDNPQSRTDFVAEHYLKLMETETKRLSKIYETKHLDKKIEEKVNGKITLEVE